MSYKAEITWRRLTEEGAKLDVSAHKVGGRWEFVTRVARFERWEPLPEPPLEDWLSLLDGLERRVPRRLAQPRDVERLRAQIKERFPEAAV
jgi:hypothetical protein